MPVALSWQQIALRLGCTLIAGMVVGLNRDEMGRPAVLSEFYIQSCLENSPLRIHSWGISSSPESESRS